MSSLDYAGYLKLSTLLSAQQLESAKRGPAAHDEMLFIIIHQAYELWFKQILYELDLIQGIFGGPVVDDAELGRAVHAAERIVRIEQLLVSQIDILETMTPMDFLEFRNLLMPASGFQSEQFRLIEVRLGLKREARLAFDGASFDARLTDAARAHVVAAEARPSLRDQIDAVAVAHAVRRHGRLSFREAYEATLNTMLAQDMDLIRNHPHLSAPEKEVQLASLQKSRTHARRPARRGALRPNYGARRMGDVATRVAGGAVLVSLPRRAGGERGLSHAEGADGYGRDTGALALAPCVDGVAHARAQSRHRRFVRLRLSACDGRQASRL